MIIGTRGSPLALAQAEEVAERLLASGGPQTEIQVIKTQGDQIQDRPLSEVGGKGLFTKEIDAALLDGRIDLAVHSMKDAATQLPDGVALAAVLPREDVRDALLAPQATDLDSLPSGALVGTASLRRQAQVRWRRPDLRVEIIRGNVQTRLRKLEAGVADATFLAVAGLNRLRLTDLATWIAPVDQMLPACAQGAIGVTIRADDAAAAAALAPLNHLDSATRIAAERAFLAGLDGDCRTPIAGLAVIEDGELWLRGELLTPDGSQRWATERRGAPSDADALGRDAAAELRAEAGVTAAE